ncbi:MAG: AMP-binding protein [Caldilineaceae bacterium]|jgi:malonyl-CoA/methylmalonyl-CoA synthetase|nr:AMP-binding protein [Caldilineaceae bacterium]
MFLDLLRHHCLAQPDKTAIELIDEAPTANQVVTYGQLEAKVLRTMALLRAFDVAPGDRVALQLPKRLPFVYLHLAIMRLGAICLPLNTGYPARELAYFLEDAEARFFFAADGAQSAVAPILADLPALQTCIWIGEADAAFEELIASYQPSDAASVPLPTDPHATCLMIYTSGTTGRPKGAELTHGNLSANLASLHEAWGWRSDDVLLHVLPIFHVHGLIVALQGALYAGATTLMVVRFDPVQTLQLLVDRSCTVFMAVPTIHRRLVDAPNVERYNLRHLRLVTSGSDRLPDDLFRQFEARFGVRLLERYGMSETGMNLSNPLHGERRIGSVGLPLPGVEVRIVDAETEQPLPDGVVGEVQVRGANVCKGYWRQPDKTAAAFTPDGWLRTGDLGLRAPDGYFTLKGRSKDLIISGGYNIYPPEVELALADHPAVEMSAVIGCPDAEWGERVVAIVVRRVGLAAVNEGDLVAFCRQRLAIYKAPRRVIFVDALPRNALGKVQKAQLRALYCGDESNG